MEAAGIEPASRDVSTAASTCIVDGLISPSRPASTRFHQARTTRFPEEVTVRLFIGNPADFVHPSPAGEGRVNGLPYLGSHCHRLIGK